jgi:hypothetical protein
MEFIQTQRTVILITLSCTLKCRLCGALSPYVINYHPKFETLKCDMDAFFCIVDKTGIIDISGGEPFLCGLDDHFTLGEVLDYLCKKYIDKFEKIRIFSNGTLLPSNRLCEVFRKIASMKPLYILFDDYGHPLAQIKEIANKLDKYNIEYSVRDYANNIYCNGWIDVRDTSLKHTKEAAKELYENCAISKHLGSYQTLINGVMSCCCSTSTNRYLYSELDKDSEDIIDLYGNVEQMRKKLVDILTLNQSFSSCAYCAGGYSSKAERFTPAEQTTREEIEEWRKNHKTRI